MRNPIYSLAPIALALLACSGAVNAASNATMNISANVVAATCDVSVSNSSLDLGNYTKSSFTAVATPIASSLKSFTVGLSNCEKPKAAGDKANLVISGQTLGGNPNIFNSTGTNTGVMISQVSAPTTYLSTGDKVAVATAGATPAVGDYNGKAISLQAGLASTSTTPDIGAVSAPIIFSFAYN